MNVRQRMTMIVMMLMGCVRIMLVVIYVNAMLDTLEMEQHAVVRK